MIRKVKRNHFSDTVTKSKDTKTIWQHFRKVNNKNTSSNSGLLEEIIFDNKRYTKSEDIALNQMNIFPQFLKFSKTQIVNN